MLDLSIYLITDLFNKKLLRLVMPEGVSRAVLSCLIHLLDKLPEGVALCVPEGVRVCVPEGVPTRERLLTLSQLILHVATLRFF